MMRSRGTLSFEAESNALSEQLTYSRHIDADVSRDPEAAIKGKHIVYIERIKIFFRLNLQLSTLEALSVLGSRHLPFSFSLAHLSIHDFL